MAEAEAKQNVRVGVNLYIRLLKQILDKLKIDPLPVAYQLRCLDGLDHWTATAQWSGGEGYDEKSFRCFGRTKIESHGKLCKETIDLMWSAGLLVDLRILIQIPFKSGQGGGRLRKVVPVTGRDPKKNS